MQVHDLVKLTLSECVNDLSSADRNGFDCNDYDSYPTACGYFHTSTFDSKTQCCVCRGDFNEAEIMLEYLSCDSAAQDESELNDSNNTNGEVLEQLTISCHPNDTYNGAYMRTEDWGGAAHFETQDGSRQLYYYADSQSRGKWSLDFRN